MGVVGRAESPEWPRSLDMRGLLAAGWRPTPFQEFVLKIHSRCNLSCDYCYMYEMADQGWKSQPRRMARPIIDQVARRVAEHARENLLRKVGITLHGGEPLLAGPEHVRYAVEAIRDAAHPDVEVEFTVQTNGVLIDTDFLDLFAKFGVSVGVSLDGDESGHDLHRKRADGRGSHRDVMAGMRALTSPAYRDLFTGFLATIDLRNDPIATYEALLAHDPPGVDFLLPHGNWTTPPPGRLPDSSTPYADWLITIFDRWYHDPGRTRVRLFLEIISLLTGKYSASEAVGLSPISMVVVETNGRIEQVDTLKSAFEGAAGTTLHVSRDPFTTALMHPSIAARQIGVRALSETCRSCPLHRVCGGGHYTHRYRTGTGFLNPSVYCADLKRLITHVHDVVSADVARRRVGHAAPPP
ncbi:FxsB family radical SAM/SPASM domain protein [Actinocorallia sp. API 0066]|uniref:FxsB family cyclophane-forming radical SAM/SPASM peptide maturase n=1 Tax=Actinocorallia sp. API 0066 TaxID=2896846 RepID=UPI001E601FEE|nr:FxsB family cyclophane-forming radical SAM/SPASM peptide maturase [Actinocorallia sp. API 0066]MCD0452386.1 FxsB family radical SAM/SPASM domain protein [Actinocorallia sp. API 0066]